MLSFYYDTRYQKISKVYKSENYDDFLKVK